jgi:hypothetical protein
MASRQIDKPSVALAPALRLIWVRIFSLYDIKALGKRGEAL